jgi:hypothetical protein
MFIVLLKYTRQKHKHAVSALFHSLSALWGMLSK